MEGEFTAGLSGEEEEPSQSPLSTVVVVTTHLFLWASRLPLSSSRLSGEDADRSEGLISSQDPSIFVPGQVTPGVTLGVNAGED